VVHISLRVMRVKSPCWLDDEFLLGFKALPSDILKVFSFNFEDS